MGFGGVFVHLAWAKIICVDTVVFPREPFIIYIVYVPMYVYPFDPTAQKRYLI